MGKQPTKAELVEIVTAQNSNLGLLQERLAELELSLEDVGWLRFTTEGQREFSREGLQKIINLCRLFFLKNPLVNRGVLVQAHYVWGQGVNISANHDTINEVLQDFLDDPKNQAELTSHQSRTLKEIDLQVYGNIFFCLFVNQKNGRIKVRSIPVDEVEDIIMNPEDAKDIWYYKRSWNESRFNESTGAYAQTRRTEYYPDWRYNPASKPATIGGKLVNWGSPVYHVKVGGLSDMRYGVPEVYQALDWAKAYKEFLEDWATLTRAYSRFAHKLTTKGKAGVAAAKAKWSTTVGAGTIETNPPPLVGSTFIGSEGVDLNTIKIGGANVSAEDGRRILLMVAAALGLPESFFGDVSVGTLATARSLDRPTELKMIDRRSLWASVISAILNFVIDWSVRAVSGKLRGIVTSGEDGELVVELETDPKTGEPIDRHIDVVFPDLLERDVNARVGAVVDAATLKGLPDAGTMDQKTLITLLLQALGVDDIDEVLKQVMPEDGEQEEESQAAVFAEALQEFRGALSEFVDKQAA